jgi:hypothetical protein
MPRTGIILVLWLEYRHAGRTLIQMSPASKRSPDTPAEDMLLGTMFEALKRLQDKPWCEVKELMEEYRPILGKMDGAWNDH